MMQKGVSVAVCMLWLHAGGVAKQGITGLFYTIIMFLKFSIDEFCNSISGTVGIKDWPRNRRGNNIILLCSTVLNTPFRIGI